MYFAGSLLKSFRQFLQQSCTSRPSCVKVYGLPISPSFSPDTTQVVKGYALASFESFESLSAALPTSGAAASVVSNALIINGLSVFIMLTSHLLYADFG